MSKLVKGGGKLVDYEGKKTLKKLKIKHIKGARDGNVSGRPSGSIKPIPKRKRGR